MGSHQKIKSEMSITDSDIREAIVDLGARLALHEFLLEKILVRGTMLGRSVHDHGRITAVPKLAPSCLPRGRSSAAITSNERWHFSHYPPAN